MALTYLEKTSSPMRQHVYPVAAVTIQECTVQSIDEEVVFWVFLWKKSYELRCLDINESLRGKGA